MDNLANPFIRDSSGLMAGDNKVQDLPNSLNNFAEYLEFPSSCDLYEIADGRLRLTTSYESLPFAENEISKETNWVRMEETNVSYLKDFIRSKVNRARICSSP